MCVLYIGACVCCILISAWLTLYSRTEDIANKMTRVECRIVNVPQLSTDTLFTHLQDSSFRSRLEDNLQIGALPLDISSKAIVHSACMVSTALLLCLCVGDGFCDHEVIDTSDRRGQYTWSETKVGRIIERSCVYNNGSTGRRQCLSHLRWNEADLMTCITRDTLELQLLAERLRVCVRVFYWGGY